MQQWFSGRRTLQSIRDCSYIRAQDEPIRERDDIVRERRDVVPDEDALRDLGPIHNVDLELFVRIVRERRGVVALHRTEPDDHVVPSRAQGTLKRSRGKIGRQISRSGLASGV